MQTSKKYLGAHSLKIFNFFYRKCYFFQRSIICLPTDLGKNVLNTLFGCQAFYFM